jgi:hypothetical protein
MGPRWSEVELTKKLRPMLFLSTLLLNNERRCRLCQYLQRNQPPYRTTKRLMRDSLAHATVVFIIHDMAWSAVPGPVVSETSSALNVFFFLFQFLNYLLPKPNISSRANQICALAVYWSVSVPVQRSLPETCLGLAWQWLISGWAFKSRNASFLNQVQCTYIQSEVTQGASTGPVDRESLLRGAASFHHHEQN